MTVSINEGVSDHRSLYASTNIATWPQLHNCSWVGLPDNTYVLLRGTASDLDRIALIYPVSKERWGASYEGWGSWDCDKSPSMSLRRRFPSARAAANALLQAVDEGCLSSDWHKRDTNWCICDYYKREPARYFCWRKTVTYEIVLREDDTWFILRNGSPAWNAPFFEEDDRELMLFESAEDAMKYVENSL